MEAATLATPVRDLVRRNPARGRALDAHGIDYGCGADVTLADACARAGAAPALVLAALRAEDDAENPCAHIDPDTAPPADLIDHIVEVHHAFLRQELPRLRRLLAKLAANHANARPKLRDAHAAFDNLADELLVHLRKEEEVLFPYIETMQSAGARSGFRGGSVTAPISVMEREHHTALEAMARIHEYTDGYTAPADACNTHKAVMESLAHLECDLRRHIAEEDGALFPRAIAIENGGA